MSLVAHQGGLAAYNPQPQSVVYGTAEPPRNSWIDTMAPAVELANMVANTEFVPKEFRNKPASIAACILYGAEIGIGPMQSLSKVDLINGRPSPRAELGRALALAAGHEVWFEEVTNTRAICCGRRRGTQHVETVTWTMDDVKKAGLAGNPNYAKYPREMLTARASAALVRRMCPEVLGGITVFAEEAYDIPEDGPAAATQPVERVQATASTDDGSRKRKRPQRGAATESGDDEAQRAADADAASPVAPSPQQTKMAMASFTETGITERADRLAATSALLGRPVESWTDVTRDEASTVIDALERLKAGELEIRIGDDGTWTIDPIDTASSEPTLPGDDDTLPLNGGASS